MQQDGKRCALCQIIYFDHLLSLDAHLDSRTDSPALRADCGHSTQYSHLVALLNLLNHIEGDDLYVI